MVRKGRLLEVLMMQLQEFCADEGVDIQSPEIFYDEDGHLIGEVDITLRSKVGTASTFLGIECRDRPSDGPQGRDWIREILGKKQDLKIDKMIAISSSGFTNGAESLAIESRIDLITVTGLETLDVSEWIEKIQVQWGDTSYTITGEIFMQVVPGFSTKVTKPTSVNHPCLDKKDGEGLSSVSALLEQEIQKLNAEFGLEKPREPIQKNVKILGPFDLIFLGAQSRVSYIEVPVLLSFSNERADVLLSSCIDESDKKIIGMTGSASLNVRDQPMVFSVVVRRNRKDPRKSDMRLSYMTENFEPCEMPEGCVVSLYGKKRDS